MTSASQVYSPAAAAQSEGSCAQVSFGYVVVDQLRFQALGVLAQIFHQLRALQPFAAARPVVHVRRRHQLPAHFHAGNQQRTQVSARGIYRRGIAGGS